MSITPVARRFMTELNNILDKRITVRMSDGKIYRGVLLGVDQQGLNLVLGDAEDEKGIRYHRVFISGSRLSEILVEELPIFDPDEFANLAAQRLGINPVNIKVLRDAGVVMILDRYKISESGVEGSGALANRIYDLWDEYIKSKKSKKA
ncbi:MAG: Lsm family RNA-binding protein [Desulfurococcales archaeon]|nr:Lsm family RNA-binding protein [Desulfurococcales archaeon]MCC6062054.1 Lsm family RNA-binding protein [Desulfurococcales archaeon]